MVERPSAKFSPAGTPSTSETEMDCGDARIAIVERELDSLPPRVVETLELHLAARNDLPGRGLRGRDRGGPGSRGA